MTISVLGELGLREKFLERQGAAFPGFDLRMSTRATGLVVEGGVVRGLLASGPEGDEELRAPLAVAADGRASQLRDIVGFVPQQLGAPIDVLWFDLPNPASRHLARNLPA